MAHPNEPYYVVSSTELATWIEQQGADKWWNVDGDSLLTSRLTFPSPGDELAAELHRIKRRLYLMDRAADKQGNGQQIGHAELDNLVTRLGDNLHIRGKSRPPWVQNRVFFLRWENSEEEWLLVEDVETTERSREDAILHPGNS